ncbi:uncharacterized protein N7500_009283 [Penicillium coprophilum]|uniref:uncharacterized protein n=1 Tax=Penicillium coprophilum TaxID=36646 RepID=UPI0023993467|nr:uncharacterized protein N7500_009283 [Penicillium coprophilum]KAJ5153844.1 hypothetical protein N7500_009283 [Penicillium coprophilum]
MLCRKKSLTDDQRHQIAPLGLLNNTYNNGEYRTYDYRVWKTGLPVRPAVLKPQKLSAMKLNCALRDLKQHL